MLRSLFSCHVTYFFIFSSSKPTVLTQYPVAQKCRPQYRFFSSICLSNSLMALFPFRNPITSDIANFGGTQITKCTWSDCILPAKISIFFHSHSCRSISRNVLPICPCNILKRYFGHHTTWYLHSHTACASFLNCLMFSLLLMLRVTHQHLKEAFFMPQSLCYLHSNAWTIRIADGLR